MISLQQGSFENCLKVVDLSGNELIKLETSTFQHLLNLEELCLRNNSIKKADYSNIFTYNKNLRKLYIAKTSFTSLKIQILHGLDNLTELDLSYNQIITLSDGLFKNQDNNLFFNTLFRI